MKKTILEISSNFETLSGGPENYRHWNLMEHSHPWEYLRKRMLMEQTIQLMNRAELAEKHLPAIVEIIHNSSPLIDENTTLWAYAAKSNLRFYFAATLVKKGICDLSNKDVELYPVEKKIIAERLRPVSAPEKINMTYCPAR